MPNLDENSVFHDKTRGQGPRGEHLSIGIIDWFSSVVWLILFI